MRALLVDGPVRLVDDHPEPTRAAGEALIQMGLAGVCGTDLQLAAGYMGYCGVLGHEFVGRVLAADSPQWQGKRVVADINMGCGRCDDCTSRDGHHCSERTVLGILGRDGALAERFTAVEGSLREVPRQVPDEHAVFAEPLAAALHVIDELDVDMHGPALVLGDGKLGQLVSMALLSVGVPVVVVGHHGDKLAIAARAGADALHDQEVNPSQHAAAFVVEATGTAAGFARAVQLTRPQGKLVLKSTVAEAAPVDLSPVVVNEIVVVGSRCGRVDRALDVLVAGSIDPTPLISATYPLSQADRALQRACEPGALKVLVRGPAGVMNSSR